MGSPMISGAPATHTITPQRATQMGKEVNLEREYV